MASTVEPKVADPPQNDKPKKTWQVYADLPPALPPAREYWLVLRSEARGLPDSTIPPLLAKTLTHVQLDAQMRHLRIAGVQLDLDCPTDRLKDYAAFLREVRRTLPSELKLSVTALLDWFRDGTDMADVAAAVDEFVPQFYDTGGPDGRLEDGAIGSVIEPAVWGPRLNRFRKPFRIGIATFGRARILPAAASTRTARTFYRNLSPRDAAANPALRLNTALRPTGELLLSYTAARPVQISWEGLAIGDSIQFTVPTPQAVTVAINAARRLGPHILGVVFFRWPAPNDALVLRPDDALRAGGFTVGLPARRDVLQAVDQFCAAVACSDLYLDDAAPLEAHPLLFRIHSTAPVEYFIAEKEVPLQLTSARELELRLPPFAARGRIYLGRVVTAEPSQFRLEIAR